LKERPGIVKQTACLNYYSVANATSIFTGTPSPPTSTALPWPRLPNSKFNPPSLIFEGTTHAKFGCNSGTILGTFGVAAGVFAVFFFGEVPRVRQDILSKVPGLSSYYDRSVPPEDNVSSPDTNSILFNHLGIRWCVALG
jgi:hypothetical protein